MQLDGGIPCIIFDSMFNKCFLQFCSQKSEIKPGQVVQLGRACTKRLWVHFPARHIPTLRFTAWSGHTGKQQNDVSLSGQCVFPSPLLPPSPRSKNN